MKKKDKYIAAFIAGFTVSAVTASAQGIYRHSETALIMKDLSNAFLVSAVLLGGIGLLTVCGSGGTFDILAYSSKRFLSLFFFSIVILLYIEIRRRSISAPEIFKANYRHKRRGFRR
jgi:hypothetical protein